MTTPAFDSIVATLTSHGTERATAERMARAKLGLPEPVADPAQVAKDASVAEKQEQGEITKMFRAYGCKVYSTSQARAARVSPGIPDIFVTHLERRLAFWYECKRQSGGVYSTAQLEFRAECRAAGVGCYGGDRYDAATVLVTLGLAVRDAVGVNGISPATE